MKIQCKNCKKTYLVPESQIGQYGKKVKCTNCNHVWYESPINKSLNKEKKSKLFESKFLILLCGIFIGLCFTSKEARKIYITYKDYIYNKLSEDKKSSLYIGKLNANEFYQDYLFLSNS
ncbi:MAG: zinc-ribbon domain-containing protein [Wolbachia endosymbiont of Fragariocoptes setiger]|nr:zinc-ribbon domain-containing protein [Wolbachia endosymbiont of Fragariocoptes setiger]